MAIGGSKCRYEPDDYVQAWLSMIQAQRLDAGPRNPLILLGQQAGWPLRQYCVSGGEESPGSMEARCRITSGGGDPRESATESKPPADGG